MLVIACRPYCYQQSVVGRVSHVTSWLWWRHSGQAYHDVLYKKHPIYCRSTPHGKFHINYFQHQKIIFFTKWGRRLNLHFIFSNKCVIYVLKYCRCDFIGYGTGYDFIKHIKNYVVRECITIKYLVTCELMFSTSYKSFLHHSVNLISAYHLSWAH